MFRVLVLQQEKQKEKTKTMKIEIEYDGSCAKCEVVTKDGRRVQFAYADKVTQTQVLEAFRCIKSFYERDILVNYSG